MFLPVDMGMDCETPVDEVLLSHSSRTEIQEQSSMPYRYRVVAFI